MISSHKHFIEHRACIGSNTKELRVIDCSFFPGEFLELPRRRSSSWILWNWWEHRRRDWKDQVRVRWSEEELSQYPCSAQGNAQDEPRRFVCSSSIWFWFFLLDLYWLTFFFFFWNLTFGSFFYAVNLGIYVNKNLRLDNIQVYGFDYDYTLAHYSANLQTLIYDLAKEHMVNEV